MVGCLYVFDGSQFHIKRLQHSAATVAWSVSFRVTLSRSLLQDHHRVIITRRPSIRFPVMSAFAVNCFFDRNSDHRHLDVHTTCQSSSEYSHYRLGARP